MKQLAETFSPSLTALLLGIVTNYVLGWREFLNHDPGHGVPPGKSISGHFTHAISDIDSHSYGSRRNSLTVTSNLRCFVYVGVSSAVVLKDVVNAINGEWSVTFHTVECEVPALTAIQTTTDPEVAIELHFQGCIMGFLDKNAVLKAKQAMK